MNAEDYTNLLRLLADFAAWLEPNLGLDGDQAFYTGIAARYLDSGQARAIVDVPAAAVAWCDLCGQKFFKGPSHRLESMTGNNFCWCPTCHSQQQSVYMAIGPEQYRAAWQRQEELGEIYAP